ncbi:proline dipeptidase pepQ [Mycoplasmopsis maculosa]|uniref:Proline dipeptidase pepQ n=1 Tax=Mycoplasmopsis maculosa TaxID=114885 RepID=A0A449B557_9BACT|nr:YigZ family protein [Mycoplasmopsis maculosa]VEU75705.1 proline dipeptidase pepQ [Mycoplasmopsis maculosa]
MKLEPEYLEIKKSKFYSFIFEIKNKEEVSKIKDELSKEYKKARHICHAYSVTNNNINFTGFSDDGEPSGTAGRPIKELIKMRNIDNVAIFVVRFFGGIKLGGGGLIRAYVKSANLAIEKFIIKK